MTNFNNYIFRCSSLGKIMSAKGDLTVANKTYLGELFTETMEGKRKEISSKYFEKGNFMEEDGVGMVNDWFYPTKLLTKNKERKVNSFISGECDLKHDGIIWDIKNAWDVFTFGKAELTDAYEWQGRGYMWLWGVDVFRLFYCINNMPEHLIIEEEKKMFYRHSFISPEDEEYQKLCIELRAFHNYDSKPIYEKFKVWEIQNEADQIEKLKAKIIKCREYLNFLLAEHKNRIEYNIKLMGSPIAFTNAADINVGTKITPINASTIQLTKLKTA